MVYVLNSEGKALMPTKRYGKVRRLLALGLAHVVRRTPFTIQLHYDTTDFTQSVTLGVDAGSKHIGLSATTETQELYSAELSLRTDITSLLATRRETRRTRRNHLRHRPARFLNRRRRDGWLAPSVENRVDTHLKVIEGVYKILPISRLVIEVAQFDTQKIQNPEIKGEEYQKGEQLGFWNVREYVLYRDEHKCQICRGKSKDPILNVHHIESRKTGGNAPQNLVTLCETCHKALHRGEVELKRRRSTALRDVAVMNIMRWELFRRARAKYPNVELTYGYITKHTRIENGLEKSHITDARCISGNPLAKALDWYFLQKQVRRHNRHIHKANILKGGKKKLNQAPYLLFGFRLFDKILWKGQVGFVWGRKE